MNGLEVEVSPQRLRSQSADFWVDLCPSGPKAGYSPQADIIPTAKLQQFSPLHFWAMCRGPNSIVIYQRDRQKSEPLKKTTTNNNKKKRRQAVRFHVSWKAAQVKGKKPTVAFQGCLTRFQVCSGYNAKWSGPKTD